MSIRPIDMQVMVQKSAEVSRLNHNESNRPEIAQQQFLDKLHKELTQKDQQVTETNKSEHQNVDKDGRGPGAHHQKSKKEQEKQSQKETQKENSTSMFDVRI